MGNLFSIIMPELLLIVAACGLFLLGISRKTTARRAAPVIALLALIVAFFMAMRQTPLRDSYMVLVDSTGSIRLAGMGIFVKMLAAAVGTLLVLLSWPTDPDAGGNSALQYGTDAGGEYFALLLLSISGIFVVAGANDIILLFLGIELASIPTYIMVSISRPLPVAQEAGVKYFFLGAMSAALLLFGFSYLYGSTGMIDLHSMSQHFANRGDGTGSTMSSWEMLGVLMVMAGLSFKMAAVPLHFYAGDVYEGAATPVTALLSFVPKTSGLIALIKILWTVGGGIWELPHDLIRLVAVVAVLTMTAGNVLGLMQHNVKRVLACSSIAHSGYMLVGVTALLSSGESRPLAGVLFYLASYGIMNVAAFGVLMLLPSRGNRPATSAETFEDLAGTGRDHVVLGMAMAVACFSLTGLPFTVGFWGKAYLIFPALRAGNTGLVVFMMINAAISAGYYLKIVGVMFLRPQPQGSEHVRRSAIRATPIAVAVALSCIATLLLGVAIPTTELLRTQTLQSIEVDSPPSLPAASAQP